MASTYTVKNVRTFQGMEDQGFNATLYRDGKRVALVIYEGSGGCCMFRWDGDREKRDSEEKLLKEHAASLPSVKTDLPDHKSPDKKFEYQPDMDAVVFDLVGAYEFRRMLKRNCRTKTLFRLPDDKPDTWRTVQRRYDPVVKAHLVKKYGPQVEIGNETIR